MVAELVVDIIKSGTAALLMSKVAKAIGEKDIADIITGTGITVIGVDTLQLLVPVCKGIMNFADKIGNAADKFREILELLHIL